MIEMLPLEIFDFNLYFAFSCLTQVMGYSSKLTRSLTLTPRVEKGHFASSSRLQGTFQLLQGLRSVRSA